MTKGGRFGALDDYLLRARRSRQLARMPPASSQARPARRRGPTSHPRMLGAEVSFSSTLPSSACQLYSEPVAAGAAGKVRNHLALLLRDADPSRILPALFALRSFSRHGHRLSRRAARSFTLASSSSARIDGPRWQGKALILSHCERGRVTWFRYSASSAGADEAAQGRLPRTGQRSDPRAWPSS